MKEKKLNGVIPPLVSPIDINENIDETGLRNVVSRCIRMGVSGLFVLGTMGEGQSIIKAERKRLIEIAVDEAKGRVPVLAGVSAEGMRKVIQNIDDALLAGADYIVTLPPYFFEASEPKELVTFYRNIARNITKPLVIYNNPYMTRNYLGIDTFKELSEEENIVGVKDSSGDFNLFMQLIREFENRNDFSIFSGSETMCDAALIAGCDGIVPGIGTLIPDVFVEMYSKARNGTAGDAEEVKSLQSKALKIMDGIYLDNYWAWVAGQKYALSCLGLCQEHFSLANRELREDEKKRVQNTLIEFGIKA